ncbi:MAG: hypothetical protein WD535_00590 [Thermaerobacterales bacterium]
MHSELQPIVAQIKQAILDNYLSADEAEQHTIDDTTAGAMAHDIVDRLAIEDPDVFPRMLQRKGLLFIVEEGQPESGGEPDVLHVNIWDGSRWIIVESVALPWLR